MQIACAACGKSVFAATCVSDAKSFTSLDILPTCLFSTMHSLNNFPVWNSSGKLFDGDMEAKVQSTLKLF